MTSTSTSQSAWPRLTPTVSQFLTCYPLLVLLGAMLLKLPASGVPGRPITWLDAMFTATSAATMTGLGVRDIGSDFSIVGQIVITLLIEISGLAFIVLTASAFHRLCQRLNDRPAFADLPIGQAARWALVSTLVMQAFGVILLFPLWHESLTLIERLGVSVFRSVCVWNQAGFAILPDGLTHDRYAVFAHGALGPMMFLAGLGAPVTYEFWQLIRRKAGGPDHETRPGAESRTAIRTNRFSAHVKVILIGSFVAYMGGVALLAASDVAPYTYRFFKQGMESNASATDRLDARRAGAIVADASFMSLSARTTGVHTRSVDDVKKAGQVALLPLMLLGAGPGSASGGVGLIAWITVLIVAVWPLELIPEDREVDSARNALLPVRLALQIVFSMLALIAVVVFLLCLSEPYPFIKILFEATSAATNTGLSLGITGDLTSFGKATLVIAMILGRSIPLMFIAEEADV